MFGAAELTRNTFKRKFIYSGYGIVFDGAVSWIFDNNSVWNVVIFCVDNSSSRKCENCKCNIIILGEGTTDDNTDSAGEPEIEFSISFIKLKTRFCLPICQ